MSLSEKKFVNISSDPKDGAVQKVLAVNDPIGVWGVQDPKYIQSYT